MQGDELRNAVLTKLSFETLDDLYAAIGYGGLTSFKAVSRIKDELTRADRAHTKSSAEQLPFHLPDQTTQKGAVFADSGVIVEDIPSCMVKFARCCTPVPGDDIVGFITKGYGVSVHRRDCPNAAGAEDPAQAGRWVHVEWAPSGIESFSTSLEIASSDRAGLFLDIATIMTSLKIRVSEMSSRTLPEGKAVTLMTFQVHSRDELDTVLARVRAVPGVTDIKRGRA